MELGGLILRRLLLVLRHELVLHLLHRMKSLTLLLRHVAGSFLVVADVRPRNLHLQSARRYLKFVLAHASIHILIGEGPSRLHHVVQAADRVTALGRAILVDVRSLTCLEDRLH